MKEKVYIFFDEFGNSHLDTSKSGTFSHFVYTAVLIKESKLKQARDIRNRISKKHFQNSDIKSNRINNNPKGFRKRLTILEELKNLNFLVYSFVINKSELQGNGLQYKKIFIKYFQKLFVRKFVENYSSFEIYADELGHPEFKRSLTEFINKHALQKDLFNPDRYYKLVDDIKDEKLVQLSDFLSGCVGKIYCTSHTHPNAEDLFNKLNDRLFVEFFPFQKSYFYANLPEEHKEADKEIASIALDSVKKYLETDWRKNPNYAEEVLRHLLLNYRVAPDRLIETAELVKVVNRFDSRYNEQNLRQAIAYLRDNSVLVVSIEGRYGYKIPNKLADIYGFYNRYLNSILPMLNSILPMLNRIKKSNEILKVKSVNDINVLELDNSLIKLKELLKVIDK